MTALQEKPKEALEAYILYLQSSYARWYARSVSRNLWAWSILQTILMLSGFASALLAALMKESDFQNLKVFLVVLPVITTTASTVLVQSRVQIRWRLREAGRIASVSIVTEGRRRFAAATSDSECTEIHRDLEKKIEALESSQSLAFFSNPLRIT